MTSCPGCGAPDDQGCYLGCPELQKPGVHRLNLGPEEPPLVIDATTSTPGLCGQCAHWERLRDKKVGTCTELSKKMMGVYVVKSEEHEDVTWWTAEEFGCMLFKST